ncbi:MAG: HD domain-containing phosphohydrolase [Gemmatimonadota bacterium]
MPETIPDLPVVADSSILIADDLPQNIRLLERALERAGYRRIAAVTDARSVLDICAREPPDLLILDLHMPVIDGFELMKRIGSAQSHEGYLPILVLTADATERAKRRALAAGARDFLTKPFSLTEALLRIRNLLETRALYTRLRYQNSTLAELVVQRTRELETARLEVLERLCQAVEFRDDVTGRHTRRVGQLSARLAERIGISPPEVDLIRRSAPLHDVGKIAVPDSILLKPGPLDPEELTAMQQHTVVGARILSGGASSLMQTAEAIARSHHERWDGGGYPSGLAAEAIPLAARIVAIVDVFDAVTTARPYRAAWHPDRALATIRESSGSHFDPELAGAFLALHSRR